MKKVLSIFCIAVFIAVVFCGCRGKIPEYEATSGTTGETMINPFYTEKEGTEKFSTKVNNVEFEFLDYYEYHDNYASLSDFAFDSEDINSAAMGHFNAQILRIAHKSDDFRVNYKAYDVNGEVIRDTYAVVKLKGYKANDVIEDCIFDVPFETVKVVFENYN